MIPLTEERLDSIRQSPRQADVTDVEDLCSEIDRLHIVNRDLAVASEQLQRIDQAARKFVNEVPEKMTFRGAQAAFNALCDALFDGRPTGER